MGEESTLRSRITRPAYVPVAPDVEPVPPSVSIIEQDVDPMGQK